MDRTFDDARSCPLVCARAARKRKTPKTEARAPGGAEAPSSCNAAPIRTPKGYLVTPVQWTPLAAPAQGRCARRTSALNNTPGKLPSLDGCIQNPPPISERNSGDLGSHNTLQRICNTSRYHITQCGPLGRSPCAVKPHPSLGQHSTPTLFCPRRVYTIAPQPRIEISSPAATPPTTR